MTIAYRNAATMVASSTSPITANYPTTAPSGDIILAAALAKHSSSNADTPAGAWTPMIRKTGGAGTDGTSDEGTLSLEVFEVTSTGGEAGGTYSQSFSGGTHNMGVASAIAMSKTTGSWQTQYAGGSINSGGTVNIAASTDEAMDFATGDYLVGFLAINTDIDGSGGITVNAPTLSGVTFGTVSQHRNIATTAGADAYMTVFSCSITGSGTGTVSFSATATSSATNRPAGAFVLVRLREGSASAALFSASLSASASISFAGLNSASTKYTRIGTPGSGPGYVQADPALASGDLVEYSAFIGGSYPLTLASDGSWSYTGSPADGRYSFDVRVWAAGDSTPGPYGTQYVVVTTPVVISGVVGAVTGGTSRRFYQGEVVTVTGTGFGATQGDSKLYVGTTLQTPTSWSDTSITFTASVSGNGFYNLYVVRM